MKRMGWCFWLIIAACFLLSAQNGVAQNLRNKG